MIENVPLFDLFTPETATHAQLLAALNDGVNPRTGRPDDTDALGDELYDLHYAWNHRPTETSIGTFEVVKEWNGGDGKPRGIVLRHVESDTYIMDEGIYSSWDSSEWDGWVIAEPYTFTETRYRAS